MFIGQFEHSLDNKNRLFIPAKFRLGKSKFVVTRGLETCLFLFPQSAWEEIAGKLNNLPLTRKEARSFTRIFASGAQECDVDEQGRILIPQLLKEYAQIKMKVTVIGVMNRIEIWDEARWRNFYKKNKLIYESTAEKLTGLGI